MIKYLTRRKWKKTDIELVEVERESTLSVWVQGIRKNKRGTNYVYHDSWRLARLYLSANNRQEIARLQSQLDLAMAETDILQAMIDPGESS